MTAKEKLVAQSMPVLEQFAKKANVPAMDLQAGGFHRAAGNQMQCAVNGVVVLAALSALLIGTHDVCLRFLRCALVPSAS